MTADSSENELMLVPTFETNARHDFEKIYYLMLDDGYRIGINDLSQDLLTEMEHKAAELYEWNDWFDWYGVYAELVNRVDSLLAFFKDWCFYHIKDADPDERSPSPNYVRLIVEKD